MKPTWVTQVGARSPQGMSVLQVAMAARVGALAPGATPFIDDRGARVGMMRATSLADDVVGAARLVRLAAPALREAVGAAGGPISLVLALPDRNRPDDRGDLGEVVLAGLAAAIERPIDITSSSVVRAGQAGGAIALQGAMQLAADGSSQVVVGGVDSYFHPDVARWLEAEDRLHSSHARDGFIPGEAAAFAAITSADPRTLPTRPLARLVAVHNETEPTTGTDQPNIAHGLTAVLRHLLGAAGEVRWAFTDCSGEEHRAREWRRAAGRNDDKLMAPRVFDVADFAGDVGAASGALALAIACGFWSAGCAPSARCLVALASDGAERGGFVLEEAP